MILSDTSLIDLKWLIKNVEWISHGDPCILMPQKKGGGQCAREIKQEVAGL